MLYSVNAKSFGEKVLNSGGIVLVNFWVRFSDDCLKMATVMDNIKTILTKKSKIVQIDVDRNKSFVQSLQVYGVPTLIIYFEGVEIARYYGTVSEDELVERLNKIKNVFVKEGGDNHHLK